jgi:exosortase/archaeosortase family protein
MAAASPRSQVTAGAVGDASAAPGRRLWPLAAALAGTLAGLWLTFRFAPLAALLEPLTVLTAAATAQLLAVLGLPVARELNVLVHAGGFACEIDLACTALVPAALLTAALLTWPRPWPARLAAVAGGVVWLELVNQLRLTSLVWVGVHAPAGFDVLHRWVWPALLALAAAGYFCARRTARPGCG